MKRVYYLNLKILENFKRRDSLDTASLICNFVKKFKHLLDSGDKQLNSIVDLLVNLERNNLNKKVENL